MKVNLKLVEPTDLDGKLIQIKDFDKAVGNLIFTNASTLEWDQIARDFHAGKEVELSTEELSQVEDLIMKSNLFLYVKNATKVYFKSLKNDHSN